MDTRCLLSEDFVLTLENTTLGLLILETFCTRTDAIFLVLERRWCSLKHHVETVQFILDKFGSFIVRGSFLLFSKLQRKVFATLMSSIKWNADRIVYPDEHTVNIWNERITNLSNFEGSESFEYITRIPIPDASLETVANAMNQVFFYNQPIALADPFYWRAIADRTRPNILNAKADSDSLLNIPQIINFMILVNPEQFKLFTRGFNDETSLYRKIAPLPAIHLISDIRALLAFWNSETELLNAAHLNVATTLSIGTFGEVYPPKRFKFLLECIKRDIEPWEGYLDILKHAWSALVIQNKLVPDGRGVLGAHDVFDFIKLMLSIKKLQRKRDFYWELLLRRKITTPVLIVPNDADISSHIEQLYQGHLGHIPIETIDGTAILENMPVDEFDRACVCVLLRDFSSTPCPANEYTNFNLDDFNGTAILYFFFQRQDLWFNVEVETRSIFLKLFYVLDIERLIVDSLRKGLRFVFVEAPHFPETSALLTFCSTYIGRTQYHTPWI